MQLSRVAVSMVFEAGDVTSGHNPPLFQQVLGVKLSRQWHRRVDEEGCQDTVGRCCQQLMIREGGNDVEKPGKFMYSTRSETPSPRAISWGELASPPFQSYGHTVQQPTLQHSTAFGCFRCYSWSTPHNDREAEKALGETVTAHESRIMFRSPI